MNVKLPTGGGRLGLVNCWPVRLSLSYLFVGFCLLVQLNNSIYTYTSICINFFCQNLGYSNEYLGIHIAPPVAARSMRIWMHAQYAVHRGIRSGEMTLVMLRATVNILGRESLPR
jgi:hypothetical protein